LKHKAITLAVFACLAQAALAQEAEPPGKNGNQLLAPAPRAQEMEPASGAAEGLPASPAQATGTEPSREDNPSGEEKPQGEDKDQLLALLDEQTAIATRTRMNADYVPGMVTVLHGDDLEARGARTVWEALALVPGMETAIEMTGRRKVLVRGLGNTFASGNVKILLNDVSMNSAELGLADPVFNIPVEQVDRIEVIRGPGSAIYGEFAYMGVINVVTRAETNRLFAFGGSFNTVGAGATLWLTSPDSPVNASLNLAGWRSSGADARTGPDTLYSYGLGSFSNAPGPNNGDVDAGTAVFKLGYEHFSLTAQWSQDGLGDHFGINYSLPPDPDHIVERSRHRTLDMRQELPLTPKLTVGVQLGWKDVQRQRDDLFVLPGLTPSDPDQYLDSRYLETSTSLGTDLAYRGWEKHAILVAASTSSLRVDESQIALDPPSGTPITIQEGTTRSITAITFQDEYRHSDLFTLTTGVRYDEYSDVGIRYSPRIAGVWRVNDSHIAKAQYAEAFRPPTVYEVATADYSDTPIQPATIRTSELGYIFKGEVGETRITAFYSELDDLVLFFGANKKAGVTFGNEGATARGFELEQRWRVSSQWSFDGNVSYVNTLDNQNGDPIPGAAPWLANAGLTYNQNDFVGVLSAHHVSGYAREAADPRDDLTGYTTVDLTGSLAHFLAPRLQWRLGIKNLFDTEVRYPAPIITNADGSISFSYPDDYPQAGRSWWTQLSYTY
jgi:iron complex outermembrane receptor protein